MLETAQVQNRCCVPDHSESAKGWHLGSGSEGGSDLEFRLFFRRGYRAREGSGFLGIHGRYRAREVGKIGPTRVRDLMGVFDGEKVGKRIEMPPIRQVGATFKKAAKVKKKGGEQMELEKSVGRGARSSEERVERAF